MEYEFSLNFEFLTFLIAAELVDVFISLNLAKMIIDIISHDEDQITKSIYLKNSFDYYIS